MKTARRNFAENIRKHRCWHGLTQDELGELAGTTGDVIRNIETARRGTTIERLLQLAKALKVEPAELLKGLT